MRIAVEELLRQVRIRDLPRRRVPCVAPSTRLAEVYRLLADERSVAVLVCEGDRLRGIFTERDVLYRTAFECDPETPVGELMTPDPETLRDDHRLSKAIGLMAEKGIRHVPFTRREGGEPGLIGGRDVLRLIAEHHPETLLNLPPRLDQTMPRPEGG